MKFDLKSRPDDMVLRVGDESITIKHRYLDAGQRATAVELTRQSLNAAMEFLWDFWIAWDDVDDADGNPIPMKFGGKDGAKNSNIAKVIGRMPWTSQLELWVMQLALNGVRLTRAEMLLADFVSDPAELRALMDRLSDFLTPPGAPGDASPTTSANGETSPSPSA